jgi:hypothetical protein
MTARHIDEKFLDLYSELYRDEPNRRVYDIVPSLY